MPQGPFSDLFRRRLHISCSVDLSTAQCASCGRLKANRFKHALLHLQGAAALDSSKPSRVISEDFTIGYFFSAHDAQQCKIARCRAVTAWTAPCREPMSHQYWARANSCNDSPLSLPSSALPHLPSSALICTDAGFELQLATSRSPAENLLGCHTTSSWFRPSSCHASVHPNYN